MTRPPTEIGTAAPLDGLAPRGMVWVAWRQRRSLIAITLGLYATATVALVVARMIRAHQMAATGVTDLAACTDVGMTSAVVGACERWLDVHHSWSGAITLLGQAPEIICFLFGLGLGAAAVGHEFERGTTAFGFTHSISPMRWAATQLGVITGAALLGIAVLDLLAAVPPSGRSVIGDDGGGPLGAAVGTHAGLTLTMVCIAFGMSVVTRSSSGGFWGGLGSLIVGGLIAALLPGSTSVFSSSDGVSVDCTSPGDELCARVASLAAQFPSSTDLPGSGIGPTALMSLGAWGVIGLVGGFLLLRRRVR